MLTQVISMSHYQIVRVRNRSWASRNGDVLFSHNIVSHFVYTNPKLSEFFVCILQCLQLLLVFIRTELYYEIVNLNEDKEDWSLLKKDCIL